jgi:hypothetical protein
MNSVGVVATRRKPAFRYDSAVDSGLKYCIIRGAS